jgi:pimeloyl-ACP methyl ester carboxylesterase
VELKMHVLAIEYPGYGLYKTCSTSEQQMGEDSDVLYDYLTKVMGIPESSIILFGRSIGSGPATLLASKRKPGALLLMSPFTSIKDIAKNILGYMSFLSTIVYERFRNIDNIKKVTCPVFLLHGQKDTLIPVNHS